ncbi:hypothetical protein AURDEDRAFT_154181 [Auricularia subglabra TFB-10046 SS5]|nr:hypothetical protein AURDEDRAFT_154181 [Auricularia subglabra TFB-10046 SS5]
MVSFPSRVSLVSVSSAASSRSAKSSKAAGKEPKWRAPGRGGSGSVARKHPRVEGVPDGMHIPRGREVPLPASGLSYSGRGGAGNAQGHYLDPAVFERVLEHEKGLIHAVKAGHELGAVKSGRGGIGNILPHRASASASASARDKRSSSSAYSNTPGGTPALTMDDSFSSRNSLASIAESSAPSTMYTRKRSLSVGSTVSSSSAYTGLHDQPPSSIPPQYLLGRRLRPTPSLESASSEEEPPSAVSTANHHLSYLQREQQEDDHKTPTPQPSSPVAIAPSPTLPPPSPTILMRRGGSHPGVRRPQPSTSYIPLDTLGLLRPPKADDTDSIMSDAASRLSLSEFPLPPPVFPPAERAVYLPPPSAPATQTSFSVLGAPPVAPRRVIPEPPQKPPPSGPLPVPPRLPPPTGPLPPVPGSVALPAPPAGVSSNDTIRAPQPKARPTLVGRMPSSSFLSVSGPSASPSPGSRPPPSPSSYFRRRPSTAPIAPIHDLSSVSMQPSLSPVPSVSPPPSASSQAASFHVPRSATSPPGFPASAPMPTTSSRGGRTSVPPREVYTPAAAPEKTAALVRALSLDTSLDNPAASSLDMNDSDSGSSADRSAFPRSAASEPHLRSKPFTHSPPSSLASGSPPTSPSPSLTSFLEDGIKSAKRKPSPNSSSESLVKTKLALAALRHRHKVDNSLLFQRSALGTTTLRL